MRHVIALRPAIRGLASAILPLLLLATPARAQVPEKIIASFCEADGHGERLHPTGASSFGDFLGWRFEPAWDRASLISGYEVRPESTGPDEVQLEVRYSVVADVTGEGVKDEERLDSVHLTLGRVDGAWRILGVPPPPHLFASDFEAQRLFSELSPLSPAYLSSSKFVWRMLIDSGWSYPYMPASAYLGSPYFKAVSEPTIGDVVAYLSHGSPYHLGIYLGDDRVTSATVRGVVRTPLNAFPGEIRYLRLTEASRPPTPEPEDTPSPTPSKKKK
jgi:hypothetical protein